MHLPAGLRCMCAYLSIIHLVDFTYCSCFSVYSFAFKLSFDLEEFLKLFVCCLNIASLNIPSYKFIYFLLALFPLFFGFLIKVFIIVLFLIIIAITDS
jgi:hypothetical protein